MASAQVVSNGCPSASCEVDTRSRQSVAAAHDGTVDGGNDVANATSAPHWDCSRCTLRNPERSTRCSACLAPCPTASSAMTFLTSSSEASLPEPRDERIESRGNRIANFLSRAACNFSGQCSMWLFLGIVAGAAWGWLLVGDVQGVMIGAFVGFLFGYVGGQRLRVLQMTRQARSSRNLLATDPQREEMIRQLAMSLTSSRQNQRQPSSTRNERRAAAPFAGMVRALPIHTYTAQEARMEVAEEEKCCAICMDEFREGDKQRMLPCFHRFHAGCVDQWLRAKGSCPTCKHNIDGSWTEP